MQKAPSNSKRGMVDKNMTKTFVIVALASVISVSALVVCRGLWSHASYMGRVIDKKEAALQQLEDNKIAADALTETYKVFDGQDPNFLGGSPTGDGPRDGSNGTLVLDALPNKYDFPALASSLDKVLEGYTVTSINGSDDVLAQQGLAGGSPVEMLFSVGVTTSYDGLKKLIDTFDRSIRPFHIVRLELSGQNSSLSANIEAKTYYQPDIGMNITNEVVQ